MSERVSLQSAEPRSWSLTKAVLVYQTKGGPRGDHAYATVHDVLHRAGRVQLASGVPATREACAGLAKALGSMAALGGFLPPNLLYLGARSLIWWRPAAPARLFFDTTKEAAGDQPDDKSGAALIGEKNGLCSQPALVFAVTGGDWYVYALEGDQRPGPSTKLLRAPYFNVWESGHICTGNVRLPESLSAGSLDVYERAFFDSRFTHPNVRGRGQLVRYPSGPYGFWADQLRAPAGSAFPIECLVEARLSVEGLAKRLEKGKERD
jgi:PRTRC genetic system protein B